MVKFKDLISTQNYIFQFFFHDTKDLISTNIYIYIYIYIYIGFEKTLFSGKRTLWIQVNK